MVLAPLTAFAGCKEPKRGPAGPQGIEGPQGPVGPTGPSLVGALGTWNLPGETVTFVADGDPF